MPYRSLSHFITVLEEAGELIRIREYVSPNLEITEITDRVSKNEGRALFFENNGTQFPLLINAFGSEKRMCLSLGVDNLGQTGAELAGLLLRASNAKGGMLQKLRMLPFLSRIASWMPKRIEGRGLCQAVVMEKPDLRKLPVLTCWPGDGGPFITLPVVHTKDPDTGVRNQGMYRMQIFGPDLTGMHWHRHKGSATHFQKYREEGIRMPVTVTLGGDPAYTYAATAPLPENIDEYMLAGFLRKKRVKLVKCLTNDLDVPCDVDFVIEGYVDPQEDFILEGPFGDHTGYYSLPDYYPQFHVTCITHRKNAIYPATIVGIPPMEDAWIGKATERLFLFPLKTTLIPELLDINMPVAGVFHNIVTAVINKTFPGQASKVMNTLWGAGQMMFSKILIILNSDVDLADYKAVAKVVSKNVHPLKDIIFQRGPVDILDHSSEHFSLGTKIGLDATEKLSEEFSGENIENPEYVVKVEDILSLFPAITGIDVSLPEEGISLVIISIRKEIPGHIRQIAREIFTRNLIRNIKFILFIDEVTPVGDISDVTWIASNNIDPVRDCFYPVNQDDTALPVLIIDGTRKINGIDGFTREWPNIITMDDSVIRKVDEQWKRYIPGPFLSSPSIKYKSLIINEGAVVKKGF